MKKTTKNDWLNNYLASTNNIMVSGHMSATEHLGIPKPASAAFRFAGNRNHSHLAFLTLDIEQNLWETVFDLLSDAQTQLSTALNELNIYLNLKIPTILYSEKCSKFGFYYKTKLIVDDEQLKTEIGNIEPDLVKNAGGYIKEINKSVNDKFQVWGRAHLSRYYVVNDFDAFTLPSSGMNIMYELKRVEEDILTWRPYLDDLTNYTALMTFCRQANIKLRVIAYQTSKESLVAVHHISSTSASEIKGSMIVCPPRHITEVTLGEKYTSSRTRLRTS